MTIVEHENTPSLVREGWDGYLFALKVILDFF